MICSIQWEAFNLLPNTTALREGVFFLIVIHFEQFLFWNLYDDLQDHLHSPGNPGNKPPRRDKHWCLSWLDSESCLKLRPLGVLRYWGLISCLPPTFSPLPHQIQTGLMKQTKKCTWTNPVSMHLYAPIKPNKLHCKTHELLIQKRTH